MGRVVVVGGSVAGVACAHAAAAAGWEAVVLEKAAAVVPAAKGGTGAGLGLDAQAREVVRRWVSGRLAAAGEEAAEAAATLPLAVDLNRATDSETKIARTLTRDENFNFRAANWADLHATLHNALPPGAVVLWGHQFLSFEVSDDKRKVVAKARVLQTNETVEITGDLLVAADGCLSTIRRHFLPDLKLRYSGYYAWRGVLDFSEKENSETIVGIRKAYPELGHCLYFDLAYKTHSVLYELKKNRLNWLWYINGPEPERLGHSVTMKVSDDMVAQMHGEAENVWVPELARLMKETEEPFVNVIYDAEPLPRLFWDNVVLVGDAAHPTTPHGLRSTNMSILDAEVLGQCLERWGSESLRGALEEYQALRLPVVSAQALHARRLGRMKQGLVLDDHKTFDVRTATSEELVQLQQRTMPYFEGAPTANADV